MTPAQCITFDNKPKPLSKGKVCLTLTEKLTVCQPHLLFLVKELKQTDKKWEVWLQNGVIAITQGEAIFARDFSRWHLVDGMPFICKKFLGRILP
jgi:hypothetical protein